MQLLKHIHQSAFFQWLRSYRITLLIALGLILLQMLVWKYLYPFPNFLPDSYSYIEAAAKHQAINLWPIGYSRFLNWFGVITHHHTGLVWFQYLLLETAILYLLYSAWYFLQPGKTLYRVMLLAAVCNPLTYQVANLVSSDALFATLSLVWFTQLWWLLKRPSLGLFVWHALVLTMAFTVRYNALYYPFISVGVILFTHTRWRIRLAGIAALLLFLGAFIGYTQYYYKKETNIVQFNPFGGWQLASNALFAYSRVPIKDRVKKPSRYKDLQEITDRDIDSIQLQQTRADKYLGSYYIWAPESPLQQYVIISWQHTPKNSYITQWSLMSSTYRDFGKWIIQTYPEAYLKYYIGPNTVNYYVPQTEFLATYNMEKDSMDRGAMDWFGLLQNNTPHTGNAVILSKLTGYIAVMLALTNLLFILCIAGHPLTIPYKRIPKQHKQVLWVLCTVWATNMLFSVLTSPIVLRYQVFPLLITQSGMFWLLGTLIQGSKSRIPDNRIQNGQNNLSPDLKYIP